MAVKLWRICCSEDRQAVPAEIRRLELIELVTLVGAALAVQVFTGHGSSGGPFGLVSYVVFQLALPFGAAFSLRRSVGQPAFVAAAVMSAGLLAGLGGALLAGRADLVPTNAYVAAGMVWVIAGSPGRPLRTVITGSTILALVMTVSALI